MKKTGMQFKIYLKSIKILLLFLAAMFIVNIVLNNIMEDTDRGVNTVMLLVLSFASISMFVIPTINFSMFRYFICFGMARKRFLMNTAVFNMISGATISIFVTAVYFMQNLMHGSNFKLLYYMGLAPLDYSFINILTMVLVHFGISILLLSLATFVCSVFYRLGTLYGISSILLVASIPLFMLDKINEFFSWGGLAAVVGIGLVILALLINLVTWVFVSRCEISN